MLWLSKESRCSAMSLSLLFLVFMKAERLQGTNKHLFQEDIVILIDTSQSWKDVELTKRTSITLLDHVSISPATTRVSILTFGHKMEVHAELSKCINRECLVKGIKRIRPSKTYNAVSLKQAFFQTRRILKYNKRKVFLTKSTGELYQTENSVPVLFLLLVSDRHLVSIPDNLLRHCERAYFISIGKHNCRRKPRSCVHSKKIDYHCLKDTRTLRRLVRRLSGTKYFQGSYTRCDSASRYAFDECRRRCECNNGRLQNCVRIRKEFTQLTKRERKRYINAYKALTSLPGNQNAFSNFLQIHKDYFCLGIHKTESFLPWHRWYLLTTENFLRQIDCRITVSYWDWAFWHPVLWEPGIHIWGPNDYQLGGNGTWLKTFCVKDGPFSQYRWKTPSWSVPEQVILWTYEITNYTSNARLNTSARCLRRRFNTKGKTKSDVFQVLKLDPKQFKKFEFALRQTFHASIHNGIGGDMGSYYASGAPEFFMHHGFLDKIWYKWQRKSSRHKYIYFLNRTMPMSHIKCNHSPSSLIDSEALPGCVKVKYSTFPTKSTFRPTKRELYQDFSFVTESSYLFIDERCNENSDTKRTKEENEATHGEKILRRNKPLK